MRLKMRTAICSLMQKQTMFQKAKPGKRAGPRIRNILSFLFAGGSSIYPSQGVDEDSNELIEFYSFCKLIQGESLPLFL